MKQIFLGTSCCTLKFSSHYGYSMSVRLSNVRAFLGHTVILSQALPPSTAPPYPTSPCHIYDLLPVSDGVHLHQYRILRNPKLSPNFNNISLSNSNINELCLSLYVKPNFKEHTKFLLPELESKLYRTGVLCFLGEPQK